MRTMISNHLAATLLAAALVLPAAAWADSAPATPATTAQAPEHAQRDVEQRIADMHATLHITKAQDPEFNAFAQVMLDNAQAMQAVLAKDGGNPADRNAEQIMQSYAEIAQQHAENVQKLTSAFGTLYASLTPAQKHDADEMFRSAVVRREQKAGG